MFRSKLEPLKLDSKPKLKWRNLLFLNVYIQMSNTVPIMLAITPNDYITHLTIIINISPFIYPSQ